MKWSIRFARIAGIDLKIHITFLIFLAWIGLTYYRHGVNIMRVHPKNFLTVSNRRRLYHNF